MPDRFDFKLLLGTIVGVVVIVILAVGCVVWTYRNQQRDEVRTHAIEVVRLGSIVENDISALENAHRGHLLAQGGAYLEDFDHLKVLFAKDSEDLSQVLKGNPHQRKQFLKIRNNVQEWLKANLLSDSTPFFSRNAGALVNAKLIAPDLDEARAILQEIQREEQFELNLQTRDQDWVIRSTRVLNFIGKMDRAASEMQKGDAGLSLERRSDFCRFVCAGGGRFHNFPRLSFRADGQ